MEGGRGKRQTRITVWHTDGAGPNRLRKARSAGIMRWAATEGGRSGKKARAALPSFAFDIGEEVL